MSHVKKSFVLLSALFILAATVRITAFSWTPDPDTAFSRAGQTGKAVFLYIYREGSMDCRMVSNESFRDAAPAVFIGNKCFAVRADLDKDTWIQPVIAKIGSYSVSLPLIVLLSSDGAIIDFHRGYVPSTDLLNFLTKNLTAGKDAGRVSTDDPPTFDKAFAAYEDQNWYIAARLFTRLDDAELPKEQKLKKHFSLGVLYYINKDYDRAIEEYLLADAISREANTLYNLACAYNLKNNRSAALFYLGKALDAGFKDIEALQKDADLAELRNTREMAGILGRLQRKPPAPAPAPLVIQKQITAVKTGSFTAMEKNCFDQVNSMRTEKGLPLLAWADDLMAVARGHSADMGKRDFFDHTNPDGKDPFDRMSAAGINYTMAAENIAYNQGYGDPSTVAADGWRKSSGHYHNIMTPEYTESAIGIAVTPDGKYFFTQVFIKRR